MVGGTWQGWIRLYGARLVLIVWVAVTVAAVAGMYHLWWTREHALYGGKDVHEQRVEVFRRAGIARTLLDEAETLDRIWPLNVRYEVKGDHNQLSYIRYLLIPRIPDGTPSFSIEEKEGRLLYRPVLTATHNPEETRQSVRGFFLSLFILSGIAALLGGLPFLTPLSVPERFGLSVLLLAIVAIFSRAVMQDTAPGFFLVAAAGGVGWLAYLLRRRRGKAIGRQGGQTGASTPVIPFGTDWTKRIVPLAVPALIIIAVSVWSILMSVIVVPDDWDAWATWGAKAKVLALGKGPLRDVTFFGLADYPLLWPAVWAFSGWCAGGWEEHWSRAWGPVFMLLCAWEIGLVVRRLTGKPNYSALAAAVFLSVPMVPLLASWSYAEAPLWLMSACSFGRLLLWRKEKEHRHLLIAALFAAAAAYTKNEGLLFSVLCFAWLILVAHRDWSVCLRWYALPLTLLYLPWFLWARGMLTLGSHAFEGFQGGAAALMRAMDRLPAALKSIGTMWLDIRQWNVVVWVVLALSIVHLVRARGHRMDLFVPGIMLLIFFLINAFHIQEIGLVMSSWNRLTVQTLPLFLMILAVNYLPSVSGGTR